MPSGDQRLSTLEIFVHGAIEHPHCSLRSLFVGRSSPLCEAETGAWDA